MALTLALVLAPAAPVAFAEVARAPLTPIELGTLPPLEGEKGGGSRPEAISGDVVVGSAVVGHYPRRWDDELQAYYRPPKTHAFAYDLGAGRPLMHDLGTLGGTDSGAVAVDGDIVIGWSRTAGDGEVHAFAYDLGAASPSMVDLGTLGGASSMATAVDGAIVVGSSWIAGDEHAFAYDLGSATPVMRDLGSLGGNTFATAVDGGVVVGHGTIPSGRQHAWAYDLASPAPVMRDLGDLGGSGPTRARVVSGNVVVGFSAAKAPGQPSYGGPRAFAFDLSNPDAVMKDLGGAFGPMSEAVDIEGATIVGTGWTLGSEEVHAFAYDLGADAPRGRDLGRLGSSSTSRVMDVDASGIVSGVTSTSRYAKPHAFTYDLQKSSPGVTDVGGLGDGAEVTAVDDGLMAGIYEGGGVVWPLTETVRLKRSAVTVLESSGAARVTVMRTGELDEGLRLGYSASPGSARAGADFEPVSGTLTFRPGEAEKSFSVPISDDARAEQRETIDLQLSAPSSGVRMLAPNVGTIAIAASDQRPDAQLSRTRGAGYVGDNIFNTTGRHQERDAKVHRGGSSNFYFRIQNDGSAETAFAVRRATAPEGLRVRYLSASKDVTRAVTSKAGWPVSVKPGGSRLVRVDISVAHGAAVGSVKIAKVAATWSGDRSRTDVVKAVVRVTR